MEAWLGISLACFMWGSDTDLYASFPSFVQGGSDTELYGSFLASFNARCVRGKIEEVQLFKVFFEELRIGHVGRLGAEFSRCG
mmetsp:Transcript_121518/g.288849  ORF Transcript_121518/g.288849 Transcript_121518/m.288849 type:complete len:83 (+) Transcript_121518:1132-1380(+)